MAGLRPSAFRSFPAGVVPHTVYVIGQLPAESGCVLVNSIKNVIALDPVVVTDPGLSAAQTNLIPLRPGFDGRGRSALSEGRLFAYWAIRAQDRKLLLVISLAIRRPKLVAMPRICGCR